MSLHTEIAELMKTPGFMYDVSEKVQYKQTLNAEEKEAVEVADAHFKNIGKTGKDPNNDIAAYIARTVQEKYETQTGMLVDLMFNRGNVGEFDYVEYLKDPKNTLVAHRAAKGGTVDRSWLDIAMLKGQTTNLQTATDISYIDLRRGGFKTVALVTTYMAETLENYMLYDIMEKADAAIVGGEQRIITPAVTQAAIDEFTLYLLDRGANPTAITQNKYARGLARLTGYKEYMSEAMRNDFNRYGLVNFIDGLKIASVSGAAVTSKGQKIFPDNRIFGFTGDKIGNLDMRGDVLVYTDFDNFNEKIVIQTKNFTYDFAITNPENVAIVEITG